jgi:hypothetical protein
VNPVLPWTRPCARCRRGIKAGSPYFERGVGPRCGGRIRRARRPAGPETGDGHHRPVALHPDQLPLPDLDPVEVTL